jgi:hypothetical protein
MSPGGGAGAESLLHSVFARAGCTQSNFAGQAPVPCGNGHARARARRRTHLLEGSDLSLHRRRRRRGRALALRGLGQLRLERLDVLADGAGAAPLPAQVARVAGEGEQDAHHERVDERGGAALQQAKGPAGRERGVRVQEQRPGGDEASERERRQRRGGRGGGGGLGRGAAAGPRHRTHHQRGAPGRRPDQGPGTLNLLQLHC